MAAGSSYPAEIIDANGHVTEGVQIAFTDSTDQPSDGTSVGGVTVTGTPSAGQVLTATSASAADWETPAVATLSISVGAVGAGAAGVGQYAPLAIGHTCDNTTTTTPRVIAAMGLVVDGIFVGLFDVPDISDSIDLGATLFVTDQTGTNTLTVSQAAVIATPIGGGGAVLDWTGTVAVVVGVDLSWNATTKQVTSTAGGIFTASLVATCTPD